LQAFAEGVEEKLQKSSQLDKPIFLLLKVPIVTFSTGQILTDKYLTKRHPSIRNIARLKLGGHNDCLDVVRKHNPEVNEAYLWLKKPWR